MSFKQARWYTKGRIKKIRLIVVHDMEAPEKGGTAEAVANYFATTSTKSSAHYNIDNNSIVQSVKEGDTAWHCPGANADGIGLEHAGYARQKRHEWLDAFSAAMLRLSAKLAAKLAKKYGIPVRRLTKAQYLSGAAGFVGHGDVSKFRGDAGGHSDPGPNFPWDAYLTMVQAELDALNGKKWYRSKLAKVAASLAIAASVFAGVTQQADPVAKPTPKPTATKPAPAPAKPTKPSTKPPVKKPVVKTLGKFPLKSGQYYGNDRGRPGNKHGSTAAERAAIKKIQKAVGVTADGRFGPKTEKAVKAAQKKAKVRVDGRVGPITWSKLRLP